MRICDKPLVIALKLRTAGCLGGVACLLRTSSCKPTVKGRDYWETFLKMKGSCVCREERNPKTPEIKPKPETEGRTPKIPKTILFTTDEVPRFDYLHNA